MPISHVIDTSLGAILIEGKGVIGNHDLELALRSIRADRHFATNLRLFGDLTGITESRLSAEGLNRISRQVPFLSSSKRAILVSGQAEFGLFRSYQAYCTLNKKPAPQIFTDRQAAIDYLNKGCPQAQRLPLDITPLKRKPSCAWCGSELRFEDLDNTHFHVSGGLCVRCLMKFSASAPSVANRFIETKEQPLLLLDGDVRVLSANSSFGALIGKPAGNIENQSGGEVFGCELASRQDGCSRMEACQHCTLRSTVNDCIAGKATAGETVLKHPTPTGTELIRITFSTERVRNLVLLRIDSLTTSAAPPKQP